MKTVYCKPKDLKKDKVITDYPNPQFKECKDKNSNIYRLHIIYPEDKIKVKILNKNEIEWFCKNKDAKLFITGVTMLDINWFPKELICGVINGRYNCNSDLAIKTGWLHTANTGTNSECFLSSKVQIAIDILVKHGFELE